MKYGSHRKAVPNPVGLTAAVNAQFVLHAPPDFDATECGAI
jgi:hypothetical protein